MKTPKFIEFRVSNYRSIRDEVIFSMQAKNECTDWLDNTFGLEMVDGGKNIRLLKTAAIYGPNASGKSNFLKAFSTFQKLLSTTSTNNIGDTIEHDPFTLDETTESSPTNYFFDFVGGNNIRYQYKFSHDSKKIFEESLDQYLNNEIVNIFKRTDNIDNTVVLGNALEITRVSNKVIPPRLFLSHLANNEAEKIAGNVYRNIQNIIIWNRENHQDLITQAFEQMAESSEINSVNEWVNRFISNADLQTLSMEIKKEEGKFIPYSTHKYLGKRNEITTKKLLFSSTASEGTKLFVGLVSNFFHMKKDGVPCLFDEINTSLHPDLCRFFIKLINDPAFNNDDTQLIFSTHDISLLDKTFLRYDQVWFTEKNQFGSTELFSAQDFEDIPENVSLSELYESGFFRAKPRINETGILFPKN
jgi:AAA15 family ATPase/GTPase